MLQWRKVARQKHQKEKGREEVELDEGSEEREIGAKSLRSGSGHQGEGKRA